MNDTGRMDEPTISRRGALRTGALTAAWTAPTVAAVLLTQSTAQAASPVPNPGRADAGHAGSSTSAAGSSAGAGDVLARTGGSVTLPTVVGAALVTGGAVAVGAARVRSARTPSAGSGDAPLT